MLELHVHATRRIRGLLQKDGIAGDFADVDWNRLTLGGEDVVHQRYVLRGEITAHREDEDAGLEGWGAVL